MRITSLIPPLALLVAACYSPAAEPAKPAPTEAEQIRQELRQLQQDYDQRLQKLEQRLQQLEATAAVPAPPAPAPASAVAVAQSTPPPASPAPAQVASQEFRSDTESREHALLAQPPVFRERAEWVLQNFVDIRGYFRAGFGRNDEGGPQVGFKAPGAESKYRLGNEADTYGELTFDKNFYVSGMFKVDPAARPDGAPDGPVAHVQTTLSVYNPYQDLLSSSGTSFGLPEIWASIGNVLAGQPSAKFWAGNRFYRRHDIHISDFFFYNMSGAGGGVEDIQLPTGKLALAWIGAASTSGVSDVPEPDAANKAGFSKGNLDLRLYEVPLPLGQGEFGLVYAHATSGLDSNGHSAPDADGVAVTFLHTHDHFISDDGVNKFSLQYGRGAAKTFTSGFETFTQGGGVFIRPDASDSWRFRLTEHFTANVSDAFSIGPALVYQVTDQGSGGSRVQWASAGVRPIWHFNQRVSLAAEGGIDWVKDEAAGTNGSLYKLTLAPQISLGGRFMSRPVFRGFVTYAHWSDAFVGQVGGNDYLTENDGLTYGMQMEAWW